MCFNEKRSNSLINSTVNIYFKYIQEVIMARGSKENYTNKQKRQADHIEQSEKKSGRSTKDAKRIGWATVNKLTGGAKNKKSTAKK